MGTPSNKMFSQRRWNSSQASKETSSPILNVAVGDPVACWSHCSVEMRQTKTTCAETDLKHSQTSQLSCQKFFLKIWFISYYINSTSPMKMS